MKLTKSSSVVIGPGAVNRTMLEDAIQAMHQVESILSINDDCTVEPGHLGGMSLMLANIQNVLNEKRALLPAERNDRRPTPDTTEWTDIGPAPAPPH